MSQAIAPTIRVQNVRQNRLQRKLIYFKVAVDFVSERLYFRVPAALGGGKEHPLNVNCETAADVFHTVGVLILHLGKPEMKYILYANHQKTKKQPDNAD